MNIDAITAQDLEPWIEDARREGVNLRDDKENTLWFGARINGRLIGCIGLLRVGNRARIRGWYVVRSSRFMKVGSALMRRAIDEALLLGCRTIEVRTAEGRRFERWGWTPREELKDVYGRPGRRYERPLAPQLFDESEVAAEQTNP